MKRIALVGLLLLVWSASAAAYTVVLKDGRRLDVKEAYRLVNTVVIFTKPDGKPVSVSLVNIDVAATEKVNRQKPGEFRQTASDPLPIPDGDAPKVTVAQNPMKKPATRPLRTLTNADFGGGRSGVADPEPAPRADTAERRTDGPSTRPTSDERETEGYWQGRVRPLLTEIHIQSELYRSLADQADRLQRQIQTNGGSYTVVRTAGGYVYVPQEAVSAEKLELLRVRDRLNDVNAQLTSLRIKYAYIQEEARRLGVPPGWVR